ncbi:uncharacterized protein LOC122646144 [Telopea speciosissima]|uniref:uncharacterized protein LOC122646144 n=1 Tax=Telopea speciosissima TaxID=54955 RepID=UPI001CC74215|nr:uncharacterized protein LOC122646144 [Telopea speciosissima]
MADRLHGALTDIISPNQSAFVPSRLISDNVLMAHEMFHYIKKRKKGSKKLISLKLDMEKAYDCLEWSFIEEVLLKLGFHTKWISLVMACIRSASYKLFVNGNLSLMKCATSRIALISIVRPVDKP